MRTHRVWLAPLALVALVLGHAGSLGAQSTAAAAWRATPASVLKEALRTAAAAQARYREQHGTYAVDAGQLALRLAPGIRVDVLAAGDGGWQGRATHPDQPGRSCVVFVGSFDGAEAPRTAGDREMAGEDGVPLCDRMG